MPLLWRKPQPNHYRVELLKGRTTKESVQMAEPTTGTQQATDTELVQESLVEEVSIDGMCGVY
jgi:mycofactocin precursor